MTRTNGLLQIECENLFLDPNLVIGVASLPDQYFDTSGKGKETFYSTLFGKHLPDYITKPS